MQLKYKSCWHGPGYRDLLVVLVDEAGKEHELHLPPADVQRVIFDCAEAATQIGEPHPPIDWEQWPNQLVWPTITPWKAGAPVKK